MQIGDAITLVHDEGPDRVACWELTEDCLDDLVALRREVRFQRAGLTPREQEVVDFSCWVAATRRSPGISA